MKRLGMQYMWPIYSLVFVNYMLLKISLFNSHIAFPFCTFVDIKAGDFFSRISEEAKLENICKKKGENFWNRNEDVIPWQVALKHSKIVPCKIQRFGFIVKNVKINLYIYKFMETKERMKRYHSDRQSIALWYWQEIRKQKIVY